MTREHDKQSEQLGHFTGLAGAASSLAVQIIKRRLEKGAKPENMEIEKASNKAQTPTETTDRDVN